MAIVPYSKRMFLQRIRKHMANGFINDAFATTDKEIVLYIDSSLAYQIKGLAFENAKIEGVLAVPEAFLVLYNLGNPAQNSVTNNWEVTLPQTPLSLPLGYSITHVYAADTANGQSIDFLPIKNKRRGYRDFMPKPIGCFYWAVNSTLVMQANSGQPLLNQNIYVEMPSSRTDDLDAPMNMPDDVIEAIFTNVVKWLSDRYRQPKDIVHDDLPAGNNNLKS